MGSSSPFSGIFSALIAIAIGIIVAIYQNYRKEITSPPEMSVPSRSGAYPTNLILEDGMNILGQRPIDNSVVVSFTLHPNGDGLGAGIALKSISFNEIDDVISKYCCGLMNMSSTLCLPNSGARLVTDTGVRMLSFNDIEDGQRVYCIPQGLHFVWPMKKTGAVYYPKNVIGPFPNRPIKLTQLSENPRVFSVDNFVSDEEIAEIMEKNQMKMSPSEVGFGGWQDDTRTSTTSWDESSQASLSIQKRTFDLLGMDYAEDQSDTLQVLRYTSDGHNGEGQWYKPHVDWFGDDSYDGT